MDESIGSPEAGSSQPGEQITLSDVIATIQTLNTSPDMNRPCVRIVEQPASKALRFRYQCEGRSAGSIPGANSTSEVKTYPAIQVCGYTGRAVVLVSCVTRNEPYLAHPHKLVGREGCKKGVCTLEIPPDTMSMTFSNLGIQCVKKRDIVESLDERKQNKVDPFNHGFDHRSQPNSLDLNAVRLCFQVYIPDVANGGTKYSIPLDPVVSEPIFDKKAMCDLTIVKLSHCASSVDGGKEDIILLCEKVTKEDIEVRFFEVIEGQVSWEAKGEFQPSQVHKQTAIWFRAPRYKTIDIIEPVSVNIQLRRPSDGACSEPLPFLMLPKDSGVKRKRKLESESNIDLLRTQGLVANRFNNNINKWQLELKKEKARPMTNWQVHTPASPRFVPPSYFESPRAGPSRPRIVPSLIDEMVAMELQYELFNEPELEQTPSPASVGEHDSYGASGVNISDLIPQLEPDTIALYRVDPLSETLSLNFSNIDLYDDRPYNTINNRQLDIKEEPREAQPYVSPIYQQHSPVYAASVSPSHFPPGPSAPNAGSPYYLPTNEQLLPPEPQWNVPLQMPPPQAMPHQFLVPTAEAPVAVAGSDAAMNVDSSDLIQMLLPEQMALYREDPLSDSFSRNLSFNDNGESSNVLDSLSREAGRRYEAEYPTFNNL